MDPRSGPSLALAAAASLCLCLASCGSPGSGSPSGDGGGDGGAFIGREWWGSWVRLDASEIWHFTDRSLTVAVNPFSAYRQTREPSISARPDGTLWVTGLISSPVNEESYSLAKLSAAVIEATDYSDSNVLFDKYRLVRDGGFQRPFGGRLLTNEGAAPGSRALRPAVGVSLTIQNVLNASDSLQAAIGADGAFESQDFVSGDEYDLILGGSGVSPYVLGLAPEDGGLSIGNLIVGGAPYSLKCRAEFLGRKISKDPDPPLELDLVRSSIGFLYPGEWYEGSVVVEKEGHAGAPALEWRLESPDGDLAFSTAVAGTLGAIGATESEYAAIPVRIRSDASSLAEYEDRRLAVYLTEAGTGRSWDDQLALRFYNAAFLLSILSMHASGNRTENVSGAVLTPEGQAIMFDAGSETIRLPYRDAGYEIALVAPEHTGVKLTIGADAAQPISAPTVDTAFAIDEDTAAQIAYGGAVATSVQAGGSRWFSVRPSADTDYVLDFDRQTVDAGAVSVPSLDIALDADGNPVVAYAVQAAQSTVRVAELEAGIWTTTTLDSMFWASDPGISLAAGAGGVLFVAGRFAESGEIAAAWRRGAGGAWTRCQTAWSSTDRCFSPRVAIDGAGEGVVAWKSGAAGVARTAAIPAAGTVLSPSDIDVQGGQPDSFLFGLGPFPFFDDLGLVLVFSGVSSASGVSLYSARPGAALGAVIDSTYSPSQDLLGIFRGDDGLLRALEKSGVSELRPSGPGFRKDAAGETPFASPYAALSADASATASGAVHVVFAAEYAREAERLRYACSLDGFSRKQVVEYADGAIVWDSEGRLLQGVHAIAAGPDPEGGGTLVWIAYWVSGVGLRVARLRSAASP